MSTSLSSGRHAASKPNYNRLSTSNTLWGHLLHKKPNAPASKTDLSQSQASQMIAPVDKAGASARVLLHDTQATLERFSARIDELSVGVQDAKKEVTTAHKVFQHGQEKLLEEQVNLVNRCQTQIQKTLGNPAQTLQMEGMYEKVNRIDSKLEALDRRVDALHMLNQTQLQALQTVQDQQGTLIALISPVSHLLDAVPLRVDGAKSEIVNVIRGTNHAFQDFRGDLAALKQELNAALAASLVRPACELRHTRPGFSVTDSVASPLGKSSRKRRKIDNHVLVPSSSPLRVSTASATRFSLDSATAVSVPTLSPASPRHAELSDGSSDDGTTSRPARSDSLILASGISQGTSHHANEDDMNDNNLPAHRARTWTEAGASCDTAQLAHATNDQSLPEPTVDLPSAVLPTNSTSQTLVPNASSCLTLSQNQVLIHPRRPQSREVTPLNSASSLIEHNDTSFSPRRSISSYSAIIANSGTPTNVALPAVATLSTLPQHLVTASTAGPTRPMSLKDRRARGLLAGSFKRGARKRVIVVDELDEDEFNGDVL